MTDVFNFYDNITCQHTLTSTYSITAKCTGGDSCCSEENRCGVGEGDCDSDADCLDGLLCGTGNCPSTRSAFWDSDDDCCYKPGKT